MMNRTIKCDKKVMEKCKYRGSLNGEGYFFCDYLGITGHRRGCPTECCDKFEKSRKKDRVKCLAKKKEGL